MKTNQSMFRCRTHRSSEVGQALLFYILVLGTFLLATLLFAFDLSNMWFHRQAAQTAADAACAAGAMDLLVSSQGGTTPYNAQIGKAYTCSSGSTDSVCSYASKNGYASNNVTPGGNLVSVSFPGSVIGITTPPSSIAANPFIRVDIVDHVQTFFAGLLNGATNQDVRAFSTCGVELAQAPIPLIVLDPRKDPATLSVQGTPVISIYGGPQRSIEVDSSTPSAINDGGNALIDLSQGGPAIPPTGSDLGVYGPVPEPTAPKNFNPGTTGHWIAPAAPINDPFAQVPAPGQPNAPVPTPGVAGCSSVPCTVPPGVNGCPSTGVASCLEYSPGYYPGPKGRQW